MQITWKDEADGLVVDAMQVLDAEGGFGMLNCDAEVDVGGYVTTCPAQLCCL